MTNINSFINARVWRHGGVRGADEKGHDLFMVERIDGAPLYGDYVEVFEENENDFNIEVGMFGFLSRNNVGNPHLGAREQFSFEECETVKQLLRSFFLNSDEMKKKWRSHPDARFLGDVRFRPNWIVAY
jgi:hypothetical protein